MTAHAQALEKRRLPRLLRGSGKKGERQKATQLLTELARRDAADATTKPPSAPKQDAEVVWALYDDDDAARKAAGRRRAQEGARWREWFAMPNLPRPDRDPLVRPLL